MDAAKAAYRRQAHDQYGKADGLRFKAVLMKLPPNVGKLKVLRGLSYADAAEKAVARSLEPMSISNRNKAMGRVGAFSRWAEPNAVGATTKTISGLQRNDPVHAKDNRNPFAPMIWQRCAAARSAPGDQQLLRMPKDENGSVDIWFGREKHEGVADAAFIQTVPGRNFVAFLRLYGAEYALYHQTWKPNDLEKVA